MFTLYHSNQLDLLKELLVSRIRQAPLSPLRARANSGAEPGHGPVAQAGAGQSLRHCRQYRLSAARQLYLGDVYPVLADVPRQSPYNKGAMSWQLMTILPALLDRPAFAPLAAYLGGEDADPAKDPEQVRLWQLCQKVADLFDQYLVYRPDWIARWEQGEGLSQSWPE